MQSIMQALSQMGISMPSQFDGPVQASTPAAGVSNVSSGTAVSPTQAMSAHRTRQALREFMHDLYSALQSQPGSATPPVSAASSGYSSATVPYASFPSKLQQLIAQLKTDPGGSSTSNASSANGVLNKLQSDFNNLVSSLSPNSSSDTANSSASPTTVTTQSLTAFLQDFLANLGNSSPTSSTGNFMNIYF